MLILAKLIAIFFVVVGCAMFLRPQLFKKLIEYLKKDNNVYVAAVIRTVFGLILIAAAFESSVTWLVFLIGLVAVISGIVIFIVGKETVVVLMDKIAAKPGKKIAVLGMIPLAVGALLLICF